MADMQSTLPLLLTLHQRLLQANTLSELGFVIANDTWQAINYRQACVYFVNDYGKHKLRAVTGMVSLNEVTPFSLWLDRLCNLMLGAHPDDTPIRIDQTSMPDDLRKDWRELWPDNALFVPFHDREGKRRGCVLFVRETVWEDEELSIFAMQAQTWGYCTQALQKRSGLALFGLLLKTKKSRLLLVTAIILLSLLPVRLSALAPAEIIALSSEIVAAPMDGVIKEFFVIPNTPVKKGTVLFALDDAPLLNRRQVAMQSLSVAKADAHATQQKAFTQPQSKAELASLLGKVREKEVALSYINDALGRTRVKASLDGIFIYNDANDWIGKPVVTGERVAQLAQVEHLGVLIWLPVGDAINLEPGADISVFLQVSPLDPLVATLVQTSYHATVSPDGVAAYRLRGKLSNKSRARIGLRGVAKIFGEHRPLAYWVFRRPMGSIRQWFGV